MATAAAHGRTRRALASALLLASAALFFATPDARAAGAPHWVSAWAAPSTGAYPVALDPDVSFAINTPGVERTVRVIVRPTLDGSAVRLRLSNAGSPLPLDVGAVRVGRSDGGRGVVRGTSAPATFAGARSVVLAPGQQVLSDPVPVRAEAGRDLAASVFLRGVHPTPSVHSVAFRTNWLTRNGAGDATGDDDGSSFTIPYGAVPVVEGLDVLAAPEAGAVVVLGDSLSDGYGTTVDGYDRWTDDLARRLHAAGRPLAVVNTGMGGNNVDCPVGLPIDGPNAVARFDRDVLSRAGVTTVLIFEGTNDLSNGCAPGRLQGALGDLAARARARGLRVVGATLIPRTDVHFSDRAKADRPTVNAWIRSTPAFDAVVDFDAAVRAPNGGGWDPRWDSGDQVHLNPAGYRRLAAAVDLDALAPQAPAPTLLAPAPPRRCLVRLHVPAGARGVVVRAGRRRIVARRIGRTVVRVTVTRPTTLTVHGRVGRAPFARTVRTRACARG